MADEMVLETQKWLNKTYGNVKGFGSVPEDGKTGWPTIYGLIRGLQYDLGLTDLVDNFGPTTAGLYDTYVTAKWGKSLHPNFIHLIQGAFWCKGIDPGGFDGIFSSNLEAAVMTLKGRAGFTSPDGVLNSIWAKALFDMSAFSLVLGGDEKIRSMQQWLNRTYVAYTGIMPCDGIYQRDTNTALIFALQAELGYAPDEATGTYGPGTTNATYAVSQGDSGNYVKVIQYGLYVNGYYKSGEFDGIFSSYMASEVESFRRFMILPPYNKIADMTVIKGLLSSAGNILREASGCDTSTQLTPAMIQTLKDNDVKIIGRYLTGTVGVGEDKCPKNLTITELENIFSAGLSVFPIYQDGGWSEDYFTFENGLSDGRTAGKAALDLRIPKGTVIYFAVDVDILGEDIPGTVVQYFTGVYQSLSLLNYYIGIYGTRNVCNQVMDSKLARFAFVSDMSTGFSGNLGFPMPKQWAFDQFIEFTIGGGSGAVGIDNVAVSERDNGFNHLENDGEHTVDNFIVYLKNVQRLADEYSNNDIKVANKLVAGYIRHFGYDGFKWNFVLEDVDDKFIEYVDGKIKNPIKLFVDSLTGLTIMADHLFAAMEGVLCYDVSYKDLSNYGDVVGWFGDLTTTCKDYMNHGKDFDSAYDFAYHYVGVDKNKVPNNDASFDNVDVISDIDGWNIGYQCKSLNKKVSDVFEDYYNGFNYNRFNYFLEARFDFTKEIITGSSEYGLLSNDPKMVAFREGVWLWYFPNVPSANENEKKQIIKGFVDKMFDLAENEG